MYYIYLCIGSNCSADANIYHFIRYLQDHRVRFDVGRFYLTRCKNKKKSYYVNTIVLLKYKSNKGNFIEELKVYGKSSRDGEKIPIDIDLLAVSKEKLTFELSQVLNIGKFEMSMLAAYIKGGRLESDLLVEELRYVQDRLIVV